MRRATSVESSPSDQREKETECPIRDLARRAAARNRRAERRRAAARRSARSASRRTRKRPARLEPASIDGSDVMVGDTGARPTPMASSNRAARTVDGGRQGEVSVGDWPIHGRHMRRDIRARPTGQFERAAATSGLPRPKISASKLVSTTTIKWSFGQARKPRVVTEVGTHVPDALRVRVRRIHKPEPVIDVALVDHRHLGQRGFRNDVAGAERPPPACERDRIGRHAARSSVVVSEIDGR